MVLFDEAGHVVDVVWTCADCNDPVAPGTDLCDACAGEYPPCCPDCGVEMVEGAYLELHCPHDCDLERERYSGYSDWQRANY